MFSSESFLHQSVNNLNLFDYNNFNATVKSVAVKFKLTVTLATSTKHMENITNAWFENFEICGSACGLEIRVGI